MPRVTAFAGGRTSIVRPSPALILVGEAVTIADFTAAVAPFGGRVIETNLDEKDVKALRKALRKDN